MESNISAALMNVSFLLISQNFYVHGLNTAAYEFVLSLSIYLVDLTWMVCKMESKWPYWCCFAGYYFHDQFKRTRSISCSNLLRFLLRHVTKPYEYGIPWERSIPFSFFPCVLLESMWCNHSVVQIWLKNSCFILSDVGWFVGFYSISTFVFYSTPKPFLCK